MADVKPKAEKAPTPVVAPTITAHAARGSQPATKADLDAFEARITTLLKGA